MLPCISEREVLSFGGICVLGDTQHAARFFLRIRIGEPIAVDVLSLGQAMGCIVGVRDRFAVCIRDLRKVTVRICICGIQPVGGRDGGQQAVRISEGQRLPCRLPVELFLHGGDTEVGKITIEVGDQGFIAVCILHAEKSADFFRIGIGEHELLVAFVLDGHGIRFHIQYAVAVQFIDVVRVERIVGVLFIIVAGAVTVDPLEILCGLGTVFQFHQCNGLGVVQPPAVAVAEIRILIVGVICMAQCDRQYAVCDACIRMGPREIARKRIDGARTCSSCALAEIRPRVFKAGGVYVEQAEIRVAAVAFVVFGGTEYRCGVLRHDHKPVVAFRCQVPFLDLFGDIEGCEHIRL